MGMVVSGVKRVGMVQQFERWTWFAFALLAQVKRRCVGDGAKRMADGDLGSLLLYVSGGGLIFRSTLNVHNDDIE
jgi:hypothetical protein